MWGLEKYNDEGTEIYRTSDWHKTNRNEDNYQAGKRILADDFYVDVNAFPIRFLYNFVGEWRESLRIEKTMDGIEIFFCRFYRSRACQPEAGDRQRVLECSAFSRPRLSQSPHSCIIVDPQSI